MFRLNTQPEWESNATNKSMIALFSCAVDDRMSPCCRRVYLTVLRSSWCFTLTPPHPASLMSASQSWRTLSLGFRLGTADAELSHVPPWLMTCSCSQLWMSWGQSSPWKDLVNDEVRPEGGWGGGEDKSELSVLNALCSAHLKLCLWTVIYCQGRGRLLIAALISWLMDLSTIGIYCCRHHFNVCMINSSINTQNIPPPGCGGFVWAWVPIRVLMVRSDRAFSVCAVE